MSIMKTLQNYIQESILDSDTKIDKKFDKKANLANHPHLARGKKQRITEYEKLEEEASRLYRDRTVGYYKYLCDEFIDRVLWKYPEIKFVESAEVNIKMGYNQVTPAKLITLWYDYKGKQFGFCFNNYFSDQICTLRDENNRDVTYEYFHVFDTPISRVMTNKLYIEVFKSFLEKL